MSFFFCCFSKIQIVLSSRFLEDIIIERWLPYGPPPERRTIVQHAPPPQDYLRPTHTVIIHDKTPVRIVRKIEKLGITQEDPEAYIRRYGSALLNPVTVLERARQAGVVEDIVNLFQKKIPSDKTIGILFFHRHAHVHKHQLQ